jgi:hypothetical protein
LRPTGTAQVDGVEVLDTVADNAASVALLR